MTTPTVETGTLASDKRAPLRFGFRGDNPEALDPNRLSIVIAAEKSSGKSYLLQSNPDAFILNFDTKPISYRVDGRPCSLATMWPMFYNGRAYHAPGKPIDDFSWEHVLQVKDYLLSIAGKPEAPAQIVLDTITAMRELLKRWLPTQYAGKDRFEQLGEGGWARLNAEVARMIDDFTLAGYGVVSCFHVRKLYYQQQSGSAVLRPTSPGDGAIQIKRSIDTSSGQWSAVQSRPSIVAGLIRHRRQKIVDGLPTPGEWITEMDLGGSGRFDECFGDMHNLPDRIELPAERPWDHFTKVFKESNS